MKAGLAAIGLLFLALLLLSLLITGNLGIYDGSYYSFTLPFMALSAGCAILSFLGILIEPARSRFFLLTIVLHALIYPAYRYAMHSGPGGDD